MGSPIWEERLADKKEKKEKERDERPIYLL
jgi:hypothetical protein